jgi:tryptophan-rich sensory protein
MTSEQPGGPSLPQLRVTLALVSVAFVAMVAYWVIWFFVDRSWLASLDTPSYFVFENAFPAADAWLAVACGAGAWTLWKRRPSALFWLLAGGSASIYLGLMDVLFDLENGVYRAHNGDVGAVATEIAINVYALGVGVWALRFGWQHRAWFLSRGSAS